jgi:O-6-methylguanine DNA methyltransferase
MEFADRVRAHVRTIPRGRVVSYGDVALAVGCPGAARAVGRVMAQTPERSGVPCHRVVRADGQVACGPAAAERLRREGVEVGPEGRVLRLARLRWGGSLS